MIKEISCLRNILIFLSKIFFKDISIEDSAYESKENFLIDNSEFLNNLNFNEAFELSCEKIK